MINVLTDIGGEIDAIVEKSFEKYADAVKYKKEIDDVNKQIDEL